MCPHQKGARLDPLLPSGRLRGFQAGVLERSRNIASNVTRGFTERRRQRTIRNNRSDTRNYDGNSSDQMRGQFAQARRGT